VDLRQEARHPLKQAEVRKTDSRAKDTEVKALDTSIPRRLGFCAVTLAALATVRPPVQGSAADATGWELIFTDTFDREELGKNWEVVEGSWKLEDGALVGCGTLISSRGFPGPDPGRTRPGKPPPGFIRLEFEARAAVRPLLLLPGAPPPKVSVSDLSSFVHVPPHDSKTCPTQTGYFFQFGGFMNTRNMIRRSGKALVEQKDPKIRITPDKLHRIVVENDEGMLRLVVDGRTVFEQKETANIMGNDHDRVGLYFYTNARLESVRVLVKRLDDRHE